MPKPLQYQTGSLIYPQGEEANRIFILQNGKVSLVYQNIETGEDVRDQVQPGEFFGVKSALGRYPREENAIALADSTIMVFTVPEFETLALANTGIILKMLKVLSTQMRRIHNQVSRLMESDDIKPDEGLFAIGEKYLKLKRYSHAKYIFDRYLTYYPTGAKADIAAKNLQAVEVALALTNDDKNQAKGEARKSPAGPAGAAAGAEDFDVSKTFYNAETLISQGKYKEAMQLFIRIIETTEGELAAKSAFELGRCLYFLGRFEDCIRHYTELLGRYPANPDTRDPMFYLGKAFEKTGKKDQAALWYEKIIAMPDTESDGIRAKTLQALEALGG